MSSAVAEQGLLHKLFRENNELRVRVHNLHREVRASWNLCVVNFKFGVFILAFQQEPSN